MMSAWIVMFIDTSASPPTIMGAGIFSSPPTVNNRWRRAVPLWEGKGVTYAEAAEHARQVLRAESMTWLGPIRGNARAWKSWDGPVVDDRELARPADPGDVVTLDLSGPGIEDPDLRDRVSALMTVFLRDAIVLAGGDDTVAALDDVAVRTEFLEVASLLTEATMFVASDFDLGHDGNAQIRAIVGTELIDTAARKVIAVHRGDKT
jgi:hypothetical protein